MHGHSWATPTTSTLKQRVIHSDVEAAPSSDPNQLPRNFAGSIEFIDNPTSARPRAPTRDGSRCYEGENCSGARPAVGAKTAILDQISHNVRWVLIDNLHSVSEDCDQRNER